MARERENNIPIKKIECCTYNEMKTTGIFFRGKTKEEKTNTSPYKRKMLCLNARRVAIFKLSAFWGFAAVPLNLAEEKVFRLSPLDLVGIVFFFETSALRQAFVTAQMFFLLVHATLFFFKSVPRMLTDGSAAPS